MAKPKDSDKIAGALGTDKTSRARSGLIAEENQLDRRSLWRIGWWGMTAVGAVALAVVASEYAQGWRQDRIASADLTRQAQAIQSLARETQRDQRQLTEAIETLNTDRDRLNARLTVLEQGLDSVTGALRQTAAPANSSGTGKTSRAAQAVPTEQQPAAASAQAAPQAAVTAPADSSTAATSAVAVAPTVAPVTTTNPSLAEKPRQDFVKQDFVKQDFAKQDFAKQDVAKQEASKEASKMDAFNRASPGVTGSVQGAAGGGSNGSSSGAAASAPAVPPAPFPMAQVASNAPASDAPGPLVAPKSIMAPPDAAASKLVEPNKSAQSQPDSKAFDIAAAKSGDASEATPTPVQRTEFAVDLGAANSLNGLRTLWRGLVKSNSELAPLRPIVILKEGNSGAGMQLRLGAGPLNDAAAAAKICAGLAENKRSCETTVYDGQRLAVRVDDKEPTAVPPEVTKTVPMQNGSAGQKGRRTWPQRHNKQEPAASLAPSVITVSAPGAGSPNLAQLFRRT